MHLRAYIKLLSDRAALILLAAAIAAAAAYVLSPRRAVFTARSTLYIGAQRISTDPQSRDLTADRVVALDRLTHTFALMIQSEPIASAAIERLRINRSPASVAAATSAATPENTNLLYVMVKDEDPTVAQRLSNALADSFAEAVQQFEPSRTGEGAVPTVPVTVFEHARLPAVPDPSSLATNMAIAVTLGLGLAVAGILLADHLDVTVKGMSDIERRLKLTVLGVVPLYDEAVAAQVVRGRWTTTGQSA